MPFRDVIGHRRLVALLARAVHRESLPPSLILSGPGGIGKRLVAFATAQALNCTAPLGAPPSLGGDEAGPPLEVDACGRCAACRRIARGVHPDVLLVEPGNSGSIKIDQVRDIIDRAAYRPFEGRRRAVIVDEADALVPAAQNALLKTLEEPPSSSVFMLVTSRPDMLLATVRSRCPRLRFRPLGAGDVAAALMKRGRSEDEARAVAATADGSIAQALEASARELVEARGVAGRVLAHAAASDDPRRRLEGAGDLLAKTGSGGAGDRDQLATHLRAMASLVRDVELLSTSADRHHSTRLGTALSPSTGPVLANPELERLSAYRGERGIRAFTAIEQALVALDRNAGVKIVADWVLLQL
jgi:DNA polymerase-3 subunit delta'